MVPLTVLFRRWLVAMAMTAAVVLLAQLCSGCSVSAPSLPDTGSCLDREALLDVIKSAAAEDGLTADRVCCRDWTPWIGESRAQWYVERCIELQEVSEECGADGWECG